MKTAAVVGIIAIVVVVIGVVSTMAYTTSMDIPEPEVMLDIENETGKFIKIELNEAISAQAKP